MPSSASKRPSEVPSAKKFKKVQKREKKGIDKASGEWYNK
jgi:hypothetical protein